MAYIRTSNPKPAVLQSNARIAANTRARSSATIRSVNGGRVAPVVKAGRPTSLGARNPTAPVMSTVRQRSTFGLLSPTSGIARPAPTHPRVPARAVYPMAGGPRASAPPPGSRSRTIFTGGAPPRGRPRASR